MEYLRILGTEITTGGASTRPREWRAPPPGRPLSRGPLVAPSTYASTHTFIIDNEEKMLLYNLRFNKKHNETIILPAPLLFDLLADKFLVTLEAVYAHRAQASTPEPEPEPEPALDPYRASSFQRDSEMASQWYLDFTSQYTGESSSGPWY